MKKVLGIAVFAAALAFGAIAQAAPINITATQQGGSNQWVLTIDATVPVAAIGIVAPNTATFVLNSNANIAPIGSGSSYGDAATPGLFSLVLSPANCAGVNCTPFATSATGTVNLGTFTSNGEFAIGFDDDSNGGTAFDGVLNPYANDQIAVTTVAPEPATAVLLGLGLGALGLVRRKAA